MNINKIEAARKCELLYKMNSLSLGSYNMEKAMALSECLHQIVKQKEFDVWKWATRHFKNEWFSSTIEFKENLEINVAILKRFQDYISEKKWKIIQENIPFSIPVNVKVNGIPVETVTGKIDFLLKAPDGNLEAVILKYRKPAASYRARKPANMVENQLELLCSKLALEKEYPDIQISIYHAMGKEDKQGNLKSYEEKKGYNILSSKYENETGQDLLKRLEYVLTLTEEEKKCETCYQRDICKSGRFHFRFPEEREKKEEKQPGTVCHMTAVQQQIAEHKEGIMNVIAVPGAGKTFTLIKRVKNMIEGGINPSHILLVTFTRKACNEIRARLENELGERKNDGFPTIETFNSWGYKIIRENPQYCGKRKLAGEVDKNAIILSLLGSSPKIRNVSYATLYGKFGLVKRLTKWFDQISQNGEEAFIAANEKQDTKGIIYLYNLYQQNFKNAGYIEYDDQINLVNDLFSKRPDIAELYAQKYRYIMVDEYQDVNKEQVCLLQHLVRFQHNLVVVGDDDQSIYSFRGADSSYMLNFKKMFPNAETVIMADNFRSNDKIVGAANTVIEKSCKRFKKALVPHMEAKNKPLFIQDADLGMLGYYISKLLKVYKPGDIAVLSRNNKELFSVANYLQQFVKIAAPKDYLKDDSIFILFKNILQIYLCGINNPGADKAVFQLFQGSGISLDCLGPEKGSLYERLVAKKEIFPIDIHDIKGIKKYEEQEHLSEIQETAFKLFQSLKLIQYSENVADTLSQILGIWDIENRTKHPVIDILVQQMGERNYHNFAQLYNHMQNMVLFDDTIRVGYDNSMDSINLLTAHDSKGKEFPVVIIYGVNDFKINDTESDDRRLLYVAMTRAEKTLLLLQFAGQNNGLYEEIQDDVITVRRGEV